MAEESPQTNTKTHTEETHTETTTKSAPVGITNHPEEESERQEKVLTEHTGS